MKALVVEPVLEIREFLTKTLEKEGFEVDETDSANIGLNLINRNRYQLITSNAWSCDGSGLALIRAIRAKHIDDPVLMCSARCRWQDIVIAYLAGTDDYMSLPFSAETLSLAVGRLMSGRDKTEENELFEARKQLLKSHKQGSFITDTHLFATGNENWIIPNEAEEWATQEEKRLIRQQQIVKARQFIFPEA